MIIRKKKLNKMLETAKRSSYNYKEWEQDFGFLTLLINRKIQIAKQFFIRPLSNQLKDDDFVHDKDITGRYQETVNEIWNTVSDSYKEFLISKYFKNDSQLITFIAETVYSELINYSLAANNEKMNKKYSETAIKFVNALNAKNNKKE